jgi:hypothetical protein
MPSFLARSRNLRILNLAIALGAICLATNPCDVRAERSVVSLAGTWRLAIVGEPKAVPGELPKIDFADTIPLPGSTGEYGKGAEDNSRPTHGWTSIRHPAATAWYEREVEIPAGWAGKRITLTLERTKRTRVWVDGREVGMQSVISAPQVYDLSDALTPGRHTLTVMVALGPLGGMQGNWNGIVGRIELTATDMVWIEHVRVTPDVDRKQARLRIRLGNRTGGPVEGLLTLAAKSFNGPREHCPPAKSRPVAIAVGESTVEVDYPMGDDVLLWDEFTPSLYRLAVSLESKGSPKREDRREVEFGMRKFGRSGTQFTINGRTILLRGTHDGCHFPLTGYPAMTTEQWVRVLSIARSYGINHYRFHTWCPPEAALAAADRVGIYMQPELPSHGGFAFGTDTGHDAFCRTEGERILEAYGNHASFVMLALGNEIGIPKPENRQAMTDLVNHFRRLDDGSRLYAEGSNCNFGNPTLNPNDDYFTTFRTGSRRGAVRGSYATVDAPLGHVQAGPPAATFDFRKAITGISVPVIGHEVGQYTVYPDFREMDKYTGVFRLRNFEVFREDLRRQGMLDQADAFVRASGALTVLCYREDIEAALRTPGFGGFQLLDLVDNQEQGTALVGILDSFMDSKGLIAPEAWRQFCCETVPLVRLEKYTWTSDETLTAPVEVAHYGPAALTHAVPEWTLVGPSGKAVARGELPAVDVPQGKLCSLGQIRIDLHGCPTPQRLDLVVRLHGTAYENRYPVWVYPPKVDTQTPPGVTIVKKLDAESRAMLAAGATVVFFTEAGGLENTVEGGFATDFWCWPMFKNVPGTMGLLCDPAHPALARFPTEFHSNWQWFHLAMAARPIVLDAAPADYRPIVQVIDNLARNHKLGLVFEARVGQGKLLVSAVDLPAMQDHPEARQLLASLLAYAASPAFRPARDLSPEAIRKTLAAAPQNVALHRTATASSQENADRDPSKAVDGDEHTRWCPADNSVGQWLRIDLGKPTEMSGAQIHWEMNNKRYRYLVEGSVDGTDWTVLADRRQNQDRSQPQVLQFPAGRVRYVRITATELEQGFWGSIREVKLFAVSSDEQIK